MIYNTSLEVFEGAYGNNLPHRTGKRFKLFPYVARNMAPIVLNLEPVVNNYINLIMERDPVQKDMASLLGSMLASVNISSQDDKDSFIKIIKSIFFDEDGKLLPGNVLFRSYNSSEKNEEKKLSEYLYDVLAPSESLKPQLTNAFGRVKDNGNVLERFVLQHLESQQHEAQDDIHYYQIKNSFNNVFASDFEYIIGNEKLSDEYLVPLIELYYFSYTAQVCFELDRFGEGSRQDVHPLFFCLDWETTSQSRKCYELGWKALLPKVELIYNHAVTLELINQTDPGCDIFDYIALCELANTSNETDQMVYEQIKQITDLYRSKIPDCPQMTELVRNSDDASPHKTEREIRYLYDCVKKQFDNTGRNRACRSYYEHFIKYSERYLRNRGRSGKMLALSEEQLLLLTRLCVKDEEKVRLNNVMTGFEKRGFFLDTQSKQQVASYFEKLNLIEKKSDSGDAMYVKRIL